MIQGGLVLETNVDEIDAAGTPSVGYPHLLTAHVLLLVQAAVEARKKSFAAANPLALGVGPGMGSRAGGSGLQTPLGWITGKLAGVGAR